MSKLHRFDSNGRYAGWILADQPAEAYAQRTDLTPVEPPAPQAGYWRHWTGQRWEQLAEPSNAPTLEQLKLTKWGQMKAARRAAIQAPLVTPYGTFDADRDSRDNIVQTAQLMQTQAQSLAPGNQPTEVFTLADNTDVTLTAAQMVQVALLLAAQIKAAYARGREVRVAIAAATNAAEVEAITWSTP